MRHLLVLGLLLLLSGCHAHHHRGGSQGQKCACPCKENGAAQNKGACPQKAQPAEVQPGAAQPAK